MFIVSSKNKLPCGLCRKKTVNAVGLGEDGYSSQSKSGQMITQVASMLAPPFQMMPGFGAVAKMAGKMGFNLNPISMALAPITGGMSLLPGISSLLGGLFKKATYFGSCMKFGWTDEIIRTRASSIVPYAIHVEEAFPEASREYKLAHVESITRYSVVANLLNTANRKSKIANRLISVVRSTPDLIKMDCVAYAQSHGENYGVDITRQEADRYIEQVKEGVRQQEYLETIKELENVLRPYQAIANQKKKVIQQTRETGLVSGPQAFKLPTGVTGVQGGALIITPGISTNLVVKMTVGKPKKR